VGVGPVRGCVVFAVAAPALHGATTADTLQLWLDPEPAPAFADAESWVGGDGPADTRGSAGRESLTWYHVAGDGLVASTVDRVITPGPGGSPPWWQDPDPRAINADIMGAIGSDRLDLRGDGTFPDGTTLPGRLQAVNVTLTTRVLPASGGVYGLSVTGRVSGERTDGILDARHFDGEIDAFARLSHDPAGSWVLSATSTSDPTWFPQLPVIPGAGYLYHPDQSLWALVGFPVTYVVWHPRAWFSAEGGFIDNVHAEADVHASQQWTFGVDYDWTEDDWRSGRSRSRDLVVLDAMRATAAVTWTPQPWWEVDLNAGLAFARTISHGDDAGTRSGERRHLGSAPTFALAFYFSG